MKCLLITPLLLGYISLLRAIEICTLASDIDTDVTIALKSTRAADGIESLNYKSL